MDIVIGADVLMGRGAGVFTLMMQDHSVMDDGDIGFFNDLLGGIPARRLEDDVVTLPLSRGFAGVHQRRDLAIEGATLAIRVGGILVGIKDLHLVDAIEKNPAVAAALAVALDLGGSGELQMQLEIRKGVSRPDAAAF